MAPLLVLESASAATDLDLISYLGSIPDARMRRGVRFPAWYLLLVAVLGILSGCQSLRDLERFDFPTLVASRQACLWLPASRMKTASSVCLCWMRPANPLVC